MNIAPGTPEWDATREKIVATEVEIVDKTNAARDAELAQGDLFASIAPSSEGRGHSNGTIALLEQMAQECGIAARTARTRRDLSSQMPAGGHLRALIENAADVQVSFETLRTVLADDQPEALLTRLIEEARAAGQGRITRDAARRLRGMVTGTVGTPQATAERIGRDPEFAKQVAEAIHSDVDATIALEQAMEEASEEEEQWVKRKASEQEANKDRNESGDGYGSELQVKADALVQKMANLRHYGRLKAHGDFVSELLARQQVENLTPEMFQ